MIKVLVDLVAEEEDEDEAEDESRGCDNNVVKEAKKQFNLNNQRNADLGVTDHAE
jgi:hypothetical protein